jgi:membrane protease YdiL (CAAX protease family)
LFFSNTSAPLIEEFGFRVCIIGAFALLLSTERSPRALLEALWRPASTYENEEIRAGKVYALSAVLVVSAIVFGLLHILSGSGWEIGKLPEATYGGLVLGYLYIRYGFHVAVLTHWGIDYLGSAFSFFGQGAYGIPWGSSPGYDLQQIVSLDLIKGIGLASFLLVLYLGFARLRRSGPVALAAASQPYSSPTS